MSMLLWTCIFELEIAGNLAYNFQNFNNSIDFAKKVPVRGFIYALCLMFNVQSNVYVSSPLINDHL